MSRRRAAFAQTDVTRLIKGALKAGMAPGSFTVKVQGDKLELLPIAANSTLDPADEAENRMRQAFGE